MVSEPFKIPFYAKAALIFIGLFTLVSILFIAQTIITPIVYSTIIAILLNPLVQFFVNRKVNLVLSISLVLGTVSLIIISCFALLSSQLDEFSEALPSIIDKFYKTFDSFINWISENYNISTRSINNYIATSKASAISNSNSSIVLTLNSLGSVLFMLILIPVYVFMLLFYQKHLMMFLYKLFGSNSQLEVKEIISSSKGIIQKYLVALLIEVAIIAVLNTIGLYILGIKYAIVLGILGATLNVVPYLGGLVAMTIYGIIALVTKDSFTYVIYVLILYSIIQFIDNNIIMPKLVGSKVKINALIAIIAVVVGGALWGIGGMFVSLPMIAILKIIFDHISSLKPWGFLLGDTISPDSHFKIKRNI
jgi:predicted PurR-regulated permease PerM